MSCYDEASGTITLPAGEAASVRADLAHLAREASIRRDDLTKKVYSRVHSMSPRALAETGLEVAIQRAVESLRIGESDADAIEHRLVRWDGTQAVLVRPTKSKPVPLRSSTVTLRGADWQVQVQGRTMTIHVSENNHACERTREDATFRAILRRLDRVRWTRGSGGTVLTQSEYTRDAYTGPSEWLSYGPSRRR